MFSGTHAGPFVRYVVITLAAMALAGSSPASTRGSIFDLTQNTFVLGSLCLDLVRAAPSALTPTNVGLTIASVEGVADIVL